MQSQYILNGIDVVTTIVSTYDVVDMTHFAY